MSSQLERCSGILTCGHFASAAAVLIHNISVLRGAPMIMVQSTPAGFYSRRVITHLWHQVNAVSQIKDGCQAKVQKMCKIECNPSVRVHYCSVNVTIYLGKQLSELILEWGAVNHRRAWGEQWDEVIKRLRKSGGNVVFTGRPHQKKPLVAVVCSKGGSQVEQSTHSFLQ